MTELLDVALAVPAVPVPFASPGLEGLAAYDGQVSPQIDLSGQQRGRYALLVASGKGLVRVRTETPALPDPAALATALSGLVPGTEAPASPQAALPAPQAAVRMLLLRCEAGELAVPARGVRSLERPLSVRPPRAGAEGWLVQLEAGLLAAERMEALLGQAPGAAPPAWCIQLDGADQRVLLAPDIGGLHDAAPDALRAAPGHGLWWLRPIDGVPGGLPVPVLDPSGTLTAFVPPAAPPPATMGLANGVAAGTGCWDVVAPAHLVAAVQGLSPGEPLNERRQPGMLPLLDLAALLGEQATPCRWALRLALPGGPLALGCDTLALADADAGWQPLPALPPLVAAMFSAVRIQGGRCQFRLHAGARQSLGHAARVALRRAAFRGWLGGEAAMAA